MSVNTEDGIHLMSRLKPKVDSIDSCLELFNNSFVYIINTNANHLIETNAFVHYICKNVLNKYSDLKPNTDICFDDISSVENTPEEELMKYLTHSDPSLDCLSLDEVLNDDSEEVEDINNAFVLVIDGFEAFNLSHFSNLVSNVNQLKLMTIIKVCDSTQLFSAVSNDLSLNLGLNPNLKLVVIYAISSNFYLRTVCDLLKMLSSFVISVPIILVVDRISYNCSEFIKNSTNFEILSIKHLNSHQIEIKINGKDNKIIKDITKPLFK